MRMDRRWAQAPVPRDQLVLVPQTLDEVIAEDHPIRVLDRCLGQMDWGAWEARHNSRRGQPPIHPRLVAGCILYGLMRGVRSSRELEDATRHRLDFIWFVEGRTIDHSTFAAFRVAFAQELKGLNREIGRLVCEQYASSLLEVVLDGTRLRANSDRHGPRSAQTLQKLIGACVAEMDRRLARMAEADAEGPDAAAPAEEIAQLRREVARLDARREGLEKALAAAQARDAVRQEHNGKNAAPVRVPVTDPDTQVTPNKEGGFAPNYTPVVAVDPVSRAVVTEDALAGVRATQEERTRDKVRKRTGAVWRGDLSFVLLHLSSCAGGCPADRGMRSFARRTERPSFLRRRSRHGTETIRSGRGRCRGSHHCVYIKICSGLCLLRLLLLAGLVLVVFEGLLGLFL